MQYEINCASHQFSELNSWGFPTSTAKQCLCEKNKRSRNDSARRCHLSLRTGWGTGGGAQDETRVSPRARRGQAARPSRRSDLEPFPNRWKHIVVIASEAWRSSGSDSNDPVGSPRFARDDGVSLDRNPR
jgi:hypothetical protein